MIVGVPHLGDLGKREAQIDEPFDAHQADEVGDAVLLVVVGATFRLGEQADLVVVPHGAQAGACQLGHFPGAPCHASILVHERT